MENILETFFSVIGKLEKNEIPYMVVGSIAAMIYGEPRLTHDMDLVIDVLPQHATKLEKLFPIEEFYCPPLEVLASEIIHRGQFNLIHPSTGLKIDFMVRKDSQHGRCEFARRRKAPFWEGCEVYIASSEDVIIKKLDFYREGGSEKHIRDIRGILAGTHTDQAYLSEWISKLGLTEQWKKVIE
jgi:hypothetical protein